MYPCKERHLRHFPGVVFRGQKGGAGVCFLYVLGTAWHLQAPARCLQPFSIKNPLLFDTVYTPNEITQRLDVRVYQELSGLARESVRIVVSPSFLWGVVAQIPHKLHSADKSSLHTVRGESASGRMSKSRWWVKTLQQEGERADRWSKVLSRCRPLVVMKWAASFVTTSTSAVTDR